MEDWKIGPLALRPTINEQGGHYFKSLLTGRVLNQRKWTPLPIPEEDKERVHCLARRNKSGRVSYSLTVTTNPLMGTRTWNTIQTTNLPPRTMSSISMNMLPTTSPK